MRSKLGVRTTAYLTSLDRGSHMCERGAKQEARQFTGKAVTGCTADSVLGLVSLSSLMETFLTFRVLPKINQVRESSKAAEQQAKILFCQHLLFYSGAADHNLILAYYVNHDEVQARATGSAELQQHSKAARTCQSCTKWTARAPARVLLQHFHDLNFRSSRYHNFSKVGVLLANPAPIALSTSLLCNMAAFQTAV